MTCVVGLDLGWATTREAEHEALHLASDAGLPVLTACTHFAADPPRVVVTLETSALLPPGPCLPAGRPVADALVEAHRTRQAGRAFVFAGAAALPAELTLAELVAGTEVDRVLALGGPEPPPQTVLRTQEFLRPELVGGELVLRVRPAEGGVVVPFEQPHPTPCCADH